MKTILGLLTLLFSLPAAAEFVIQRGGEEGQSGLKGVTDNREALVIDQMDVANLDMIIDGRYVPVKEHGTAKNSSVGGAGSGVPLSQGIRLLAPEGFTVYKSPQVDGDAIRLSWFDGENLTEVLERAGAEHGVMFEIDWDKQVLAIRPGQPKLLALNADDDLALELANAIEQESQEGESMEELALISGVDLEAPVEIFDIYQGENLRNLAPRVAARLGLSRAVMDFAPDSPEPSLVRSPATKQIEYRDRADLLYKLNDEFVSVIGGPDFRIAQDGSNDQALVLSTRGHPDWASLFVFDVMHGDLRRSAMALAGLFGYKSREDLWMNDVNWPIAITYPIIVTDPAQAFQRLFDKYPMQAQLVSGTREALFVPRMQPKTNGGQPKLMSASREGSK